MRIVGFLPPEASLLSADSATAPAILIASHGVGGSGGRGGTRSRAASVWYPGCPRRGVRASS